MRLQAPILVLKARVEMAEGRFADAIRTLETGYSFSQQAGDGPFLINCLVGVACESICTECLTEMMEQPGAPNLYWALAVIPRPLVDMRNANEIEQKMLELQFPDLADLDRPRSAAGWDRALANVRKELDKLRSYDKDARPAKPGNAATDPGSKSPDLPAARKYLSEVVGIQADALDAMPAAEVLLRYLVSYYHELRDEVFKLIYLPFPPRLAMHDEADQRMKAATDTEAGWLARWLLPAVRNVQMADVRMLRRLAILQAIEALRMHAAANDGKLPEKLDQIKVVPVPDDPGTGKPFEYRLEGPIATLISRIAGTVPKQTAIRYRVTVRK